jgi:hypothetical protein
MKLNYRNLAISPPVFSKSSLTVNIKKAFFNVYFE